MRVRISTASGSKSALRKALLLPLAVLIRRSFQLTQSQTDL